MILLLILFNYNNRLQSIPEIRNNKIKSKDMDCKTEKLNPEIMYTAYSPIGRGKTLCNFR